jgi:hypothetical protein
MLSIVQNFALKSKALRQNILHSFLGNKKRHRHLAMPQLVTLISDCTLNLIGTEASGTSVHMARSSVNDSLNTLNVGLPSTVGTSVGVGNLNTEGHALATKITLRHFIAPPILKSIRCALAGA